MALTTLTVAASLLIPNRYFRSWNRFYLRDYSQHFEFGGRQWRLDFVPPAYPLQLPIAMIATVILGGLITAMVLIVQQRAQAALAQAQELSELKQQLFGMASHELRTPLSTILLSAQSLEAAPQLSPERARRTYQRIRSAAQHMTQLLNDLLTLNRAEAGKLDYVPEAIRLKDFCHTCMTMILADQTPRIRFHYTGSNEPVWLDPKLVHAIITNLLANALKYSDATVGFEVEHQANQASLTVRDQGAGIPADEQARVFETFYRGKNATCIPGTGLGLAIVQSCVKLHRGTIQFRENYPQGSIFTVQLPIHPPSGSPPHR
ncbi:MAG: HAMP domain-containing histidine kinase [Synechococcaceae cyanobacterium SM2_3_60]|nr:HAMP domain-containing histidine kinase [Synechococcaceae cyanobacterium SM2_3_60]